MSIHALSWVLRHSEAKNGARLVLIALADFAHDDGSKAFPSIETLMEHTRLGRTAVKDALRRLAADGHIEETGRTRAGTTVWCIAGVGFRRLATDSDGQRSDSDPDPLVSRQRSEDPPHSPPEGASNGRKILKPGDEPVGFSEWLGHHVETCERHDVTRSVPQACTSYRSALARTFAALVAEGYELEDFKLASDGVLADEFMRSGGHTAPENVLRKTKIAKRIDEGRAWRAAQENDKYARFG